MKILFLDFDGVLLDPLKTTQRDEYGWLFEPSPVAELTRVIEVTGCKLVISSSWGIGNELGVLEMWLHRNMPGEIIGFTPNLSHLTEETDGLWVAQSRGEEIAHWLDANPSVTHYAIVDDVDDMTRQQRPRLVLVAEDQGLTPEAADRIIALLTN